MQILVAAVIGLLLPADVSTTSFVIGVWVLSIGTPVLIWSAVISRRPSPGEQVSGTILSDRTGARPGWARIALRTITWWAGVLLFPAAPISVLLTPDWEGIHGLLSGTFVRPNWGPGRCHCCGYDRTGMAGDRCAECGFVEDGDRIGPQSNA